MTKHSDDLVQLCDVVSLLPRPVAYSTVWRWTRGVRGKQLSTVMIGGRLFTKKIWVDEFLADCTRGQILASQDCSVFLETVTKALKRHKGRR